ncbi:MAG: HPr family phosphocarrier protein [Candidatus Izemoplasma sp.]|nr:HPr family phosphocarrier protein [Candidatus Izemoplasma sp.]
MEIKINSTEGLHALLASRIVQLASKYDADIRIEYEDTTIDARSILGLVSLAVPKGENIRVIATGTEAEVALNELKKILS